MRSWTNEQLTEAVKTSNKIGEVIKKLGLTTLGRNYSTVSKYITELKLDISHFLSRDEILKEARSHIKKLPHDQLFAINEINRSHIKRTIMSEGLIDYKCKICGISEWNGQKLSLHLDHINGINNDNRLENLRFLCPNCHSLTENYCAKNKKRPNIQEEYKCLDCDKIISNTSIRCRSCTGLHRMTKISWPPTTVLLNMVESFGYRETAKQLGISDSAVKKHIQNHPND